MSSKQNRLVSLYSLYVENSSELRVVLCLTHHSSHCVAGPMGTEGEDRKAE